MRSMKKIRYRIQVRTISGNSREFDVTVEARDFNSGITKALHEARGYVGRYEEIHRVEFMEVLS